MDLMSVIPVTHNARDLGGISLAGGSALPSGIVLRSDALTSLTDDGQAALATIGVGVVVDLRTDGERARAADRLSLAGDVRLVVIPIQGGAMDELVQQLLPSADGARLDDDQIAVLVGQIPTLEDLYIAMLDSSATQFADVARTVVEAQRSGRSGVLFHCTAGKDRTGLAAALLLSVAGASRESIIADYVRTEANLAGAFAEQLTGLVTALGVPLTPRLETLATKSPATAITAALDWLDTEHGGAQGYLRSGGLRDEEIEQLSTLLRETTAA